MGTFHGLSAAQSSVVCETGKPIVTENFARLAIQMVDMGSQGAWWMTLTDKDESER